MKIRNALFVLFLAIILCISPQRLCVFAATPSKAECVIEVHSKRILTQNNATARLPMASTTKILTAIIIIDDCNLSETVRIPKAAVGVEGSSVYLKEGEEYTVEELLYGLMLRSGNDCAVALALHHSGSIRRFAQVMNERANILGAESSQFINPHGLPSESHYTTAFDLAVISSYAMQNETFRTIVSCKYYPPRRWKNKNKMLYGYDGAIGVKTGFTLNAGRCLVTCALRNEMMLVCTVLNSPQMYERTAQLLNDCYLNYAIKRVFDCSFPVEGLQARYSFDYPLKQTEHPIITVQKDESLMENGLKGEIAGQMKIHLENDLLFSQNLYIM